jgi:hypothetical protein
VAESPLPRPAYSGLRQQGGRPRLYKGEKIGEEYLEPIYGVYEAVEDIDISVLPKEFVLKSTHGSGHVIICTDKDKLNWKQEFDKMRLWLLTNFYYVGGEWQYKEMKPRIICEKLLSANITDYKFFCYNGEPQYLATCIDRLGELRISHYDMDYRPLPFKKKRPDIKKHVKPESFEEMKKIARVLCRDFPFVRVDLYDIDGKIYFSELTFTPGNGLTKFDPIEWDLILGKQFDLSCCKNEYVIE